MLTTKDAGERLGISASRVRQLILEKRLPATKSGRDLLIKEEDLWLVADRKSGRPAGNEKAHMVAEEQAPYGNKAKEPDGRLLASVKKAYKELAKYDEAVVGTELHKEITPILRALRKVIGK